MMLVGTSGLFAQSAQVQLNVTQNDMAAGGTLLVQVENKVTGISPSTLGSVTLDIQYDSNHLTYVNSSNGAFGFAQGYGVSVTDNATFVRLSIQGTGVSPGNGVGHDIPAVYDANSNMRVIEFAITAQCVTDGTTDLTFFQPTGTVGYFDSQSNNNNTGNIIAYAPDMWGDATGIQCDPNLPVELGSFDGFVDGSRVRLAWSTASEVGTSGFAVEHKGMEGWDELGFVEAAGSGSEYSFDTSDLDPGTHSFRLKIVDTDGSFEYSDAVELTVEVPGEYALTDIYPNPFNPTATFTLAVGSTQEVEIGLYNSLGQMVGTLHSGTLSANEQYTFDVDGAGLTSGLYLVQIKGQTFGTTRSITLLK